MLEIKKSVGEKGVNRLDDVRLVQVLLNTMDCWKSAFKKLSTDGKVGKMTINAIKQFQREIIGIKKQDGKVDPNGRTFRYLTMYLFEDEERIVLNGAVLGGKSLDSIKIDGRRIDRVKGFNAQRVSYKGSLKKSKQLVSEYAKDIIKMALKEAGMSEAVITDTVRQPKEQAEIMLRNAKIDLSKQYKLYGRNGDKVLKVYESNKAKKDTEIVSLMVDKISELERLGKKVSRHCASVDSYNALNIIDIGCYSTRLKNKKYSQDKFTSALKDLEAKGYIEKLIDETKKSNKCWHVEILVNKMTVYKYYDESILNQVKYIA